MVLKNVSWPKTKIQSLGTGPQALGVPIGGQQVEHVDQFCYLGSIIDSSWRCSQDILRRICIASSSMNSMSRAWSQSKLWLATKLRIYEACIIPILLYSSETWTILKVNFGTPSARTFYMWAQRRILGVRWQDMIKNVIISEKTGLPPISVPINKRRLALFGHLARLTEDVPANRALWTAFHRAQWSLPLPLVETPPR